MAEEHPNMAILKRFDPANVAGTVNVFAEDAIFHYFNPLLPELHGDYVGRGEILEFFKKLATLAGAAFELNLVSVTPVGDELVVLHRKHKMVLEGRAIESDVVVVWRFVEGKITEVWDIPSIHAAHVTEA